MDDADLYSKPLVNVLSKMLGRIDAAMLAARAAEAKHQMRETALHIACHMMVGQSVNRVQKAKDLTVVLKKTDNGLVKCGKFFVRLISPRVVCAAAVEDIASAVSRFVSRHIARRWPARRVDYPRKCPGL